MTMPEASEHSTTLFGMATKAENNQVSQSGMYPKVDYIFWIRYVLLIEIFYLRGLYHEYPSRKCQNAAHSFP
jgi:hypothetical protein